MKSVRYWRLWNRLFGWDYAQIAWWHGNDHKRYPAGRAIRRVWIGVDGRRYYLGCDAEGIKPLDTAREALPLTWVSENDTLHAFADLVQKQLQEE